MIEPIYMIPRQQPYQPYPPQPSYIPPAPVAPPQPIVKQQPQNNKEEYVTLKMDGSSFKQLNEVASAAPATYEDIKKRKKKTTKTMPNGDEIIPVENSEMDTMVTSNKPYSETYNETNSLLKIAINQIDVIATEVKDDLDDIRASKTLRKKYDYIPNLASTMAGLMSTKVNAIREMNNSITHAHDLELKRIKDLKLNEKNDVTDEKHIMDMYNAFISMPYQQGGQQYLPNVEQLNNPGFNNIIRADIGTANPPSGSGFDIFSPQLSSVQNSMRFENDPNVKKVVFYDSSTGRRWFDVIDLRTGESIDNVERPDAMFLEDITLDINNKIARNTNLDQTYDLIVVNSATMQY